MAFQVNGIGCVWKTPFHISGHLKKYYVYLVLYVMPFIYGYSARKYCVLLYYSELYVHVVTKFNVCAVEDIPLYDLMKFCPRKETFICTLKSRIMLEL